MKSANVIGRQPGDSSSQAPSETRGDVARILGLSLIIRVILAEREMAIDSILTMRPGTIIEFDVPFNSELLLYAGNRAIGRGQAVKVGEKFGLRTTRIDTVRERIESFGF